MFPMGQTMCAEQKKGVISYHQCNSSSILLGKKFNMTILTMVTKKEIRGFKKKKILERLKITSRRICKAS